MTTDHGGSAFIVGPYRYTLSRWVTPVTEAWTPYVCFVMLNPSTADALVNDATIRKCMGFTERWHYPRFTVVNVFALRSRDPKALATHADPIGPHNFAHITQCVRGAALVVPAWGGSFPRAYAPTVRYVDSLIHREAIPAALHCLGRTAGGEPRHPLMLAYNTPLEPW